MQYATLVRRVAFIAGAYARLRNFITGGPNGPRYYNNAICTDEATGGYLYNAEATEAACFAYSQQNTAGDEQGDGCPDCQMVTVNEIPLCQSAGGHIEDKKITAYCVEAGAKYANT